MKTKEYTPALGYDWLSIWYDLAIKLTMPEQKFRNRLIDHLNPVSGERILEFGGETEANLLIAAMRSPDSQHIVLDNTRAHQSNNLGSKKLNKQALSTSKQAHSAIMKSSKDKK